MASIKPKDALVHEWFRERLLHNMNDVLKHEAEPIIQRVLEEASKEIEQVLREKIALMLIRFVEQNFDFERHGQDLRICIRQAFPVKEIE